MLGVERPQHDASRWSGPHHILRQRRPQRYRVASVNAWRGSIPESALFHFVSNIPRWPDAHLYDNYPIVVVGVIVIRTNCRTTLTHERAINDVMKPDHGAQTSP